MYRITPDSNRSRSSSVGFSRASGAGETPRRSLPVSRSQSKDESSVSQEAEGSILGSLSSSLQAAVVSDQPRDQQSSSSNASNSSQPDTIVSVEEEAKEEIPGRSVSLNRSQEVPHHHQQ